MFEPPLDGDIDGRATHQLVDSGAIDAERPSDSISIEAFSNERADERSLGTRASKSNLVDTEKAILALRRCPLLRALLVRLKKEDGAGQLNERTVKNTLRVLNRGQLLPVFRRRLLTPDSRSSLRVA